MTRDAIINQLFTGKNFNDCIGRMEPAHLQDDLKMEVIAIVCEWNDEKIRGLHERKELDFYVVRVILNLIQSNTSPFYKKFRVPSGNVVYDEYGKEDVYTVLEHYNRMPRHGENRNPAVATPSFLDEADELDRRTTREEKEVKALEEAEGLYWYHKNMLALYIEHGTYRAVEKATRVPYVSCFRTVSQSIQEIRQKIL